MKQIKYLIVGILVFVTGITLVSAADKTYYLDFTTAGDHDVNSDSVEFEILYYARKYFDNNENDKYTTEFYEQNGGYNYRFKINDKLLFTWHRDDKYITVENALTESDNFTIDVLTNITNSGFFLILGGGDYTKINVVFKSSTSVPKNINNLTVDLTKPELCNGYCGYMLQFLFFLNGEFTSNMVTTNTTFPVKIKRNNIDIISLDETEDGEIVVSVVNQDKLTTDDNITLTKEYFENAEFIPDDDSNNYKERLLNIMYSYEINSITYVLSNKAPVKEEEEDNPKTYDGIMSTIIVASIGLTGIGSSIYLKKKYN